MFVERRKSERRGVLRRGIVIFDSKNSTLDCTVLDLSTGGAKIKSGSWLFMPDAFDIKIDNGITRRARVCHKDLDTIGISFQDGVAS